MQQLLLHRILRRCRLDGSEHHVLNEFWWKSVLRETQTSWSPPALSTRLDQALQRFLIACWQLNIDWKCYIFSITLTFRWQKIPRAWRRPGKKDQNAEPTWPRVLPKSRFVLDLLRIFSASPPFAKQISKMIHDYEYKPDIVDYKHASWYGLQTERLAIEMGHKQITFTGRHTAQQDGTFDPRWLKHVVCALSFINRCVVQWPV